MKENLVNLAIVGSMAALAVWFFRDKSLSESITGAGNVLLMIVGLSFVIFIHELGHFVAAKLCGVRVHTFSVGFGPPIPGLSFRKGETFYKIAAFPLGGYVQMLGQEDPGVEAKEGFSEDDPRSYKNKSVGQRMFIISAGVTMNVILGLVIFVYVYSAGKTEMAPRFGAIESGSPADIAGLQAGSELVQVDDSVNPSYEDLLFASLLSTPDRTPIFLEWRTPSGKLAKAQVMSRRRENDLRPTIGVGLPIGLEIYRKGKIPESPSRVADPAEEAAFEHGDKLVGVRADDEKDFRPLRNGWELREAEFELRSKTMVVQVERGQARERAQVTVEPQYVFALGERMEMGPILAIGRDCPEVASVLQAGDVITAVDGDKAFDPLRLPDMMADKAGKTVALEIRRQGLADLTTVEVVPEKGRGSWNAEIPMSSSSAASIPSLGIAYAVKTKVVDVAKGSAAEGKLRAGDTIKEIRFRISEKEWGAPLVLDEGHWQWVFLTLQLSAFKEVEVKVERGGGGRQLETLTLVAGRDKTWAFPRRGFDLQEDKIIVQAESIQEAIALGFRDTYRSVVRVYLNLKSLMAGILSVKLVSGPIGIVKLTYAMAERGLNDLLLLLGMLSINLAVINFLPIPILDGGHMVFLTIEKVLGKPPSERALIIANTVGLVLLGCLMVFVIYLDISKMF